MNSILKRFRGEGDKLPKKPEHITIENEQQLREVIELIKQRITDFMTIGAVGSYVPVPDAQGKNVTKPMFLIGLDKVRDHLSALSRIFLNDLEATVQDKRDDEFRETSRFSISFNLDEVIDAYARSLNLDSLRDTAKIMILAHALNVGQENTDENRSSVNTIELSYGFRVQPAKSSEGASVGDYVRWYSQYLGFYCKVLEFAYNLSNVLNFTITTLDLTAEGNQEYMLRRFVPKDLLLNTPSFITEVKVNDKGKFKYIEIGVDKDAFLGRSLDLMERGVVKEDEQSKALYELTKRAAEDKQTDNIYIVCIGTVEINGVKHEVWTGVGKRGIKEMNGEKVTEAVTAPSAGLAGAPAPNPA